MILCTKSAKVQKQRHGSDESHISSWSIANNEFTLKTMIVMRTMVMMMMMMMMNLMVLMTMMVDEWWW